MFPYRAITPPSDGNFLPLVLYCIGCHNQTHLARPDGFTATQFFLDLNGKGVFHFYNGKDTYLSKGKAIIIPAKVAHEYWPLGNEPWNLAFVCFKQQPGIDLIRQMDLPCNQSFPIAGIGELWELFKRLYQNECVSISEFISSSVELYNFILLFANNYRISNTFEKTEDAANAEGAVDFCQSVKKLAATINTHYTEGISVTDFSAGVGYSLQQLERLFKKEYGISPRTYLKMVRLQQSLNLMDEHPTMHVDEVAKAVGLDANYFIRIFKDAFGVTPKQYKKNPSVYETNINDFLYVPRQK